MENGIVILILLVYSVVMTYQAHYSRGDYRRKAGADRRAAYEDAMRHADADIDHFVSIRSGTTDPENRYERGIVKMSDRQFVGLLRDTYQRYGLDVEAEMLWTQYLRQKSRFDIVDEKGNVVYFGEK